MLVSTLALMLLPAGCTGKTDLYSRQERFLPASSLMPQEPSQRAELIFAQLKLDARLSWQRHHLRVYLDGNNITATRYCDFGGLKMPEGWFSGGIVVTY